MGGIFSAEDWSVMAMAGNAKLIRSDGSGKGRIQTEGCRMPSYTRNFCRCRIDHPYRSARRYEENTDVKSLTRARGQGAPNKASASASHLQRSAPGPAHTPVPESHCSVENPIPLRPCRPMTGETEAKSRASDGTLDFSFVPAHPQGVIRPRMVIQPKLTIHTEGDAYEQEADLIADRVMRMPARRAEPAHVQMKAESPGGAGFGVVPPIVHEVLQGSGQPLDEDTRAFADPRFGQDFSRVRVHTDTKAADSARAIHAQAYTAGNDVVFGPGQFAPHTGAGRKLLVHELAHVVQQGGFSNPAHVQRQPAPTKKKDEETKKRDSVRLHNEQQKHVADLLAKARSTKTSAALDPLAAGNIYRNEIGLLDSGRLTLTIPTPTHYSPPAHSTYFHSPAPYPTFGGDYIIPDGKTQGGGPGIDRPIPGESGATQKVLPQPVLQPMPPKVETPPGGSAPAQGEQPAPAT